MQKIRLSDSWLKKIIFSLLLIFITSLSISHSAPKTVLVLGDSLSAEYGIARGTGWVALLEQRIKDNRLDARVVNASISGDTTSGGLARLNKLLGKENPTIVVIELGANDGLRGLPLVSVENNILKIISESESAKAKVLLIGMRVPPNYGPTYTDQFATMFKKIASEEKIPLVPFLLEDVANKSENFQADRLHPLATAHPQILDNVWPYLLPMLKNSK